ncbi:MAG: glucose 1-dehydrogenase [Clostridiales bacterium]|nr:glucose 1-dehydrogenase [Clostridiales bacterium]
MKTVLITGASGGIGRAIVKKFVQNGYTVIAQYNKNKTELKKLIEELERENLGGAVYPVTADFTDLNSIDKMFEDIFSKYKKIDAVVNNAGVGLYKLITETTEQDWDKVFNVNIKSIYYLVNKVLPSMIDNKSGKIVNVSSMWGIAGASMEVAYSASKSALIGYTKALAKELAPSGINVNCVCPGVIDTEMNARFSKEEVDVLIEETPLNRLGTPNDVAELIYFLCSDSSSFITGQTISCDGGFI